MGKPNKSPLEWVQQHFCMPVRSVYRAYLVLLPLTARGGMVMPRTRGLGIVESRGKAIAQGKSWLQEVGAQPLSQLEYAGILLRALSGS